jgi:hypothetical protein
MRMQRQQVSRERVADGSIELSNSSHTATVPWKKQGASPRALGRLSRVFTARKTQTPSFVLVLVLHGSTTQTHRTQARTKKRRRAGAGARKKTPPLCVREGGVALSEPLHACHAPAPAFICSALCPFPALYKLTTLDAEIDHRPLSAVPSSRSFAGGNLAAGWSTYREGAEELALLLDWSPVSSSTFLFRLHSGMFRFIQHLIA